MAAGACEGKREIFNAAAAAADLPFNPSSLVAIPPPPLLTSADNATLSPPRKLFFQGFEYTLKNDCKKVVTYYCKTKRGGKNHCNGMVKFAKDKRTNKILYAFPDYCGTAHTRTCCVNSNISNMATYQWAGRDLDEPSPSAVGNCLVATKTVVTADMIRRTDEIATQNPTFPPAQVWSAVRAEMDVNHPNGWDGLRKDQVCRRVPKARAEVGLGVAITTVLNTPQFRMMSDQGRAFLQAFGSYPHPDDPNEFMCMMIFGNPVLIPMLKQRGLDILVDATFDLGCQLLSNSNLILGVTVTGTFPCYCVYCDYCYFFK